MTPPQSTVAPPLPGGVFTRMLPLSNLIRRSLDWNEKREFAPKREMEVSAKVSSAMEEAAVVTFEFSPIFSFTFAGAAPDPGSCCT